MASPLQAPPLADERWPRFLEATAELRRPIHWPGGLADVPPFDEGMLASVLRAGTRALAAGASLRVFAGGGQREDHRERVLASPPRTGEELEAWLGRLFPDERVGLKLGHLEALDGPIARVAAERLAPLLARVGLPSAGISIGAFIGAYGLTPFGIHHDPLTHVFHAHLRGCKRIHFWTEDAYRRMRGDLTYCYDVTEAQLETAEHRFELGPASLLYFPGDYYHIAASPSFSVGVVVVLTHHCRRDILRAASAVPLREALGASAGAARGPLEQPMECEAADDEQLTARAWLCRAIEAHRRRLRERGALAIPAAFAPTPSPPAEQRAHDGR